MNSSKNLSKYCLFKVSFVSILAERDSLSLKPKKSLTPSAYSITTERQNASKVIALTSLFILDLPMDISSPFMRSSISSAALFVKVRSMTSSGLTSGLEMMFT